MLTAFDLICLFNYLDQFLVSQVVTPCYSSLASHSSEVYLVVAIWCEIERVGHNVVSVSSFLFVSAHFSSFFLTDLKLIDLAYISVNISKVECLIGRRWRGTLAI